MNMERNRKDVTGSYQWLEIGSWVSFALAIILTSDIAIVGAIFGYFLMKNTGKKIPFYANLILIAISFLYGFIIGIMGSM